MEDLSDAGIDEEEMYAPPNYISVSKVRSRSLEYQIIDMEILEVANAQQFHAHRRSTDQAMPVNLAISDVDWRSIPQSKILV